MKEMIDQAAITALASLKPLIPGAFGGVVDYLNKLQKGERHWSFVGFLVHLVSAMFFGWILFEVAIGWGYDGHLAGALSGLGGFLGTRVADLAQSIINKYTGR